jgi:fructose 1,6-bisphosphatase
VNKKDFDLKLWSYIQSESTFFDLRIDEVTKLLKRDLLIDDGIAELNFMFPKITEDELKIKYKQDLDISGSESIIYWDKDKRYIYKLNDPMLKAFDDRFNEIIMYYILQEYLFPNFKYDTLKICEDKMFIRQRVTRSPEPSQSLIDSCMINA